MAEWTSLLADVGFPVVVTLYLLVRIEGKLENLTLSIRELSQNIVQLRGNK
ncbi:YvrJ family protein [Bacillaceae bacterium]